MTPSEQARTVAELQTIIMCRDAEITRLRAEVEFYANREKHFAEVLSVCDGGQYRNDWDSRIREIVDNNKQLRAEVEELTRREESILDGARKMDRELGDLREEIYELRRNQIKTGEVRARRVNCKFAPKSNATWCEECVEPLGCSWIVEVKR